MKLLLYTAIIAVSAMFYGYVNTPTHTFEVWPSDQKEHTVYCYPFRMEVKEWDSIVLVTSDTGKVINEVSQWYVSDLEFVFFLDNCVQLQEDSLRSCAIIKNLIAGGKCFDNSKN